MVNTVGNLKFVSTDYLVLFILPLTAVGCYNTNARVENIELWWILENNKISDENQCFDWIKFLMDIDWLILVGSLVLTYLAWWFDLFNHNP